MLWIGLTIGMAMGFALAAVAGKVLNRAIVYMRLEKELAQELRARAKQERAAAALRAIAENERQAQNP